MNTPHTPRGTVSKAALTVVGGLTLLTASLALKQVDGNKDPYGVASGFNILGSTEDLLKQPENTKKQTSPMADFSESGGL